MAYSDDAVKAKLSALNETQDSIVTVAQWIMFYRRHADRTAQLWLSRLQEAPAKRLNLIYLANEVVQQSRARSRTEFLLAFEPVISDATAIAYKGASLETQGKIKRVVEVWRSRNIFDVNIQSTTEKRLQELDEQRGGVNGAGGKAKLGGSLFGNSSGGVPPELSDVAKAASAITRAEASAKTAIPHSEIEYETIMSPEAPIPTPPVYAARLNTLLKGLASAQTAVEGCIKARQDIIAGMEKLLETHRAKLVDDEKQFESTKSKHEIVEAKKKSVEDQIMLGLSSLEPAPASEGMEQYRDQPTNGGEAARPEPESFTPPAPDVEAFTPPPNNDEDTFALGEAVPSETLLADTTGAETIQELPPTLNEPAPAFQPPTILQGQTRQASGEISQDPRVKRRKTNHPKAADIDDEIFNNGSLGVDEDAVSAMLGN